MASLSKVVPRKNDIDLALSVMCVISKRDETLNTVEIAEVCGCSQTLIAMTLRNALEKLRGHKGLVLRDFI
jgi:hypothetical protein